MEHLKQLLAENYGLGAINEIRTLRGGYLNENFVIISSSQNYFLQKIRAKSGRDVAKEIAILEFLKEKKFPCAMLIKNKTGTYLTAGNGCSWLVSDFINGYSPERFNGLSELQLIESAKILAKLHQLTSGLSLAMVSKLTSAMASELSSAMASRLPSAMASELSSAMTSRLSSAMVDESSSAKNGNPNTPSAFQAIKICEQVKLILSRKSSWDNFDKQVSLIINKKIALLKGAKFNFPQLLLPCPKIFCHGDFHGANLIFDNKGHQGGNDRNDRNEGNRGNGANEGNRGNEGNEANCSENDYNQKNKNNSSSNFSNNSSNSSSNFSNNSSNSSSNSSHNSKIVGVVDWEFFGYDYRVWEVARSMSFICDINYTGSMSGPIDFKRAYLYLKTYLRDNPLTITELESLVPLLQHKSLCCCFTLEKHYLEGNTQTDIFLPKTAADWFWWIERGTEFEEKVIAKLKAKQRSI